MSGDNIRIRGATDQTALAANPILKLNADGSLVTGPNTTAGQGTTDATYTTQPPRTGTDRSITATTTAQQLMPANTSRNKFLIRNDSATDVWINFGGTATAAAGSGNLKVAANGGNYEYSGYSGAVSIITGTGTAAITAREF